LSSGLLEEARKDYADFEFIELNMLNLDIIDSQFTDIFFYASFHHLQNIEDRKTVLQKTYDVLKK
jgi:ubiquinone/menaquinone biosynthesis C-methylase UbiE